MIKKPYCCILILCEGQAELRFFDWLTDKIKTNCLLEGQDWRFVFHPTAKGSAGKGHSALRRAMNVKKGYDHKFIIFDAGDQEAEKTREIAIAKKFKRIECQLFIEDFLFQLAGKGAKLSSSKEGASPKEEFKSVFGGDAHKIDFQRIFPDFRKTLKHDLLKVFHEALIKEGLELEEKENV